MPCPEAMPVRCRHDIREQAAPRTAPMARLRAPGTSARASDGDTVLTGALRDQAALYGVLVRSRRSGWSCSKSAACPWGTSRPGRALLRRVQLAARGLNHIGRVTSAVPVEDTAREGKSVRCSRTNGYAPDVAFRQREAAPVQNGGSCVKPWRQVSRLAAACCRQTRPGRTPPGSSPCRPGARRACGRLSASR